MKKSSKLLLCLIALIAILAVTYRAVNWTPSTDLTASEQVLEVMTEVVSSATPPTRNYRFMPIFP